MRLPTVAVPETVAAPRYEFPETVSAVDEAYGNWLATVVEVATR